jgi:hypothetical protein
LPGDSTGAFAAAKRHAPKHNVHLQPGSHHDRRLKIHCWRRCRWVRAGKVLCAGRRADGSSVEGTPRCAGQALADRDQYHTLDGDSLTLGSLIDRPTILVIPRYYGCLPCRDYLRQVSARYDELEAADGAALGVSVGADFQARWLIEKYAIRFPLLVDPQCHVYDALYLPPRWWVGLNPRGWWKYAQAISRGNRQGRIVEPNQLPGFALLDEHADVVWMRRRARSGRLPNARHGPRQTQATTRGSV